MTRANQKKSIAIDDSVNGGPLSGASVELRRGASTVALVESATLGKYKTDSIAVGEWQVWIDSVYSGHNVQVGAGEASEPDFVNDTDKYLKSKADGSGFELVELILAFDDLTGKPTTISGYGITDAYTKSESDTNYAQKNGDLAEAFSALSATIAGSVNASSNIESTKALRSTGQINATGLAGVGLEMGIATGGFDPRVMAFDRTTGQRVPLRIDGNPVYFYNNNVLKMRTSANGVEVFGNFTMNGSTAWGRLATAPTATAGGDSYYNTVSNIPYIWNGANWIPIFGQLDNRVVVTQSNHSTVLAAINSQKEYFLDGVIDVGSLSIEVPSGGINITGYNFEVSKIITSQPSHELFQSAIGGSGSILFKDFSIEVTGAGSKVYDIAGATGSEAYEIARINFNDCSSLGVIDNFRQGFETGTGRFGGKPELELKGTWSGGYYIDSSIVRSLVDGSYSLFKAGAGFSMLSRFRSNQNIDLNTTVSFFDFAPSNFPNPNTVQLDGCIVSRNGAFDALDTTITPNMTEGDVETYWKNNTGLKNTYVGGRLTVTAESATVISAGSTFYDLNATWGATSMQHFSEDSNGVLVHDGINPTEFQLLADLNIESSQNNVLETRWAKWKDSTSSWVYFGNQKRQVNALVGGRDMAFFTMLSSISLSQGDKIKLQVANNNGNNNVTVELDSFAVVQER